MPPFVTMSKAIEAYGLSRSTLYRLIGAKKITAKKLDKLVMIDVATLEQYIRSQPNVDLQCYQ